MAEKSVEKSEEKIKGEEGYKIYEIGYLLISSVPMEKVADIVTYLKEVLSKKGAMMIAEEAPELRELAYTMIKKIGTANQRFDQGYFGWLKFELSTKEIEEVKKAFETHPDMLRILVITTIRGNTYLGQKAATVTTLSNPTEATIGEGPITESLPIPGLDEKVPNVSATVEEMDKSIDEMVKGA